MAKEKSLETYRMHLVDIKVQEGSGLYVNDYNFLCNHFFNSLILTRKINTVPKLKKINH